MYSWEAAWGNQLYMFICKIADCEGPSIICLKLFTAILGPFSPLRPHLVWIIKVLLVVALILLLRLFTKGSYQAEWACGRRTSLYLLLVALWCQLRHSGSLTLSVLSCGHQFLGYRGGGVCESILQTVKYGLYIVVTRRNRGLANEGIAAFQTLGCPATLERYPACLDRRLPLTLAKEMPSHQ